MALPTLLAPIFGPILGGVLLDNLGWQWIFLINVPVGALIVLLALLVLPADKAPTRQQPAHLDWPGLALVATGTSVIIYGVKLVTETRPSSISPLNPLGSVYGWGYWPVWGWLGGGTLLLAAFAIYTRLFSADPVLDLRLYRRGDFRNSSLVFVVGTVLTYGIVLLVPVFLQKVRLPPLSALETGITLMPLGIGALLGVVLCAGFYDRVGPRALVVVGAVVAALGVWRLSGLRPTSGGIEIWPWLAVVGLGLAATVVPVQALALQGLSGRELTTATSLFMTARLTVAAIGSAVLATLFIQQTTAHRDTITAATQRTLPAGTVPDPNSPVVQATIQQVIAQAGTMAINDVFGYVAVGTLLTLPLALLLPGRHASRPGSRVLASGPR